MFCILFWSGMRHSASSICLPNYLAPDLIPYYFDALKRYRINCIFKMIDMEKDEVLANLNYFTQWGGRAWAHLCRHAIHYLGDLHGKILLEIGPRYGRMS